MVRGTTGYPCFLSIHLDLALILDAGLPITHSHLFKSQLRPSDIAEWLDVGSPALQIVDLVEL